MKGNSSSARAWPESCFPTAGAATDPLEAGWRFRVEDVTASVTTVSAASSRRRVVD